MTASASGENLEGADPRMTNVDVREREVGSRWLCTSHPPGSVDPLSF
jgi:hypothetical protein